MKNFLKLIAAIAVCNSAGIIGSIFTAPAIDSWYATINKPTFNPPNWLFAPVWTTLFTLMGVSLFLLIKNWKNSKQEKSALIFFAAQLILNILWSIIFFGNRLIGLALLEIIILLAFIIITAVKFYKINKPAGWLFLPYIIWVGFAAVLNFTFFLIN